MTATPAARASAHNAWLNDSTNALLAAVHCLVRRGLESDRGRNVEDPAAASSEHSWQKRASQGDHGTDVDCDLIVFSFRVGLSEWAVAAEPGVVDQHFDGRSPT